MLDRRRGLIEQIFTLLDVVDETFDEQALRDEMVRTLVDLAERETAKAAALGDQVLETARSGPRSEPNGTRAFRIIV